MFVWDSGHDINGNGGSGSLELPLLLGRWKVEHAASQACTLDELSTNYMPKQGASRCDVSLMNLKHSRH